MHRWLINFLFNEHINLGHQCSTKAFFLFSRINGYKLSDVKNFNLLILFTSPFQHIDIDWAFGKLVYLL